MNLQVGSKMAYLTDITWHSLRLANLARFWLCYAGMGRRIRHMLYPHQLTEVTTRCVQGRFLFRPSKDFNDILLGVLGRSLERHREIRLYLFVVVSNHMHLILSAPDTATLSSFMCYFNSNLARETGRLRQWKERIFGRRYTDIAILDDEALVRRLRYLLAHGVKENLVEKPVQWPGVHCIKALTLGKKLSGHWFDRTDEYEHNSLNIHHDPEDFATPYPVNLTPLPCWADLSESERQARWKQLVDDIEREHRQRRREEGIGVLGKRAILAADPQFRPDEPKKSPAPACHASNEDDAKDYREIYRNFVAQYYEAMELLLKGVLESLDVFPENCYIPPFAYRRFKRARAPG